jgi:Yip1-like protein
MATTVAPPEPSAEPQPSLSAISRIFGVFFSPKSTFQDIARKPSWVAPVVLMTLFGIAVGFCLNQRVDWREVSLKRIEDSSRASQLSAEQKEQQAAIGAKISPYVSYCIGAFFPILITLIVGGAMLVAYNLFAGANANYKVAMAIVSHAYVVSIVSSLLFILILYLKPPGTIDLENPVAANLGAFLPDGSAKWLVSLGSAIDIFSFWIITLIGIGFAAFNPKKLKTGGAIGIALVVWGAYEVVRVGIAFVFS